LKGRKGSDSSRRAIVGLAIILLIIIGDLITGASSIRAPAIAGCNSPASLEQCGTATCTITYHQCVTTVTFATSFSSVPKHIEASWAGVNFAVNHADSEVVVGTFYFQSDNAETWVNMPAVQTELYGNQNHETTVIANGLPIAALGGIAFGTCIMGSNSGTAVLRPMYTDGQGGAIHELAANSGFMDLKVDDAGTCLGFAGIGPFVEQSGLSALAAGFVPETDPVFLVGINGGGVGDNPIFNNLGIVVVEDFFQNPAICVNSVTQCDGSTLLASTTQFRIQATIAFVPIGSFIMNFDWMASE